MNEIFTPALVGTAAFCLIVLILLIVPVLFTQGRRWRDAWRMRWAHHALKPSSASPATKRRIEQLSQSDGASQDPLGWSGEENTNDVAAVHAESSESLPGEGKTILIADDDAVVVFALARRLQQLGYTVLRSPDAVHALLGAMRARPDLVILDVNMPSGNGLAVCEMMASDPQYAGTPVIIHSAIADEATKLRSQRLGAHHVEKSARSWSEIRALVERLLPAGETAKQQPAASALSIDNTTAIMPRLERPRPTAESVPTVASVSSAKPPAAAAASDSPAPTPPASGPVRLLCIESPKDRLETVHERLSSLGVDVVRTSDLNEGYWTCFTEKPDLIVVHAAATENSLPSLLNNLATHPVTRSLPVLWIKEGDAETALPATGKVTILPHPLHWEDLLVELEKILPGLGRGQGELFAATPAPASKTSHTEHAATTADDHHLLQSVEHKPLTVLCVDDDALVAQSIALRLEPYGIVIKTADNGTTGYLRAVSETPDLILLDLKMPNGEGTYVLSRLKDNARTKDIPVIVLTSETASSARRTMFGMGADAYVTKPVDWLALYTEMGRCVQLPKKLLADFNLPEQLTLAEL